MNTLKSRIPQMSESPPIDRIVVSYLPDATEEEAKYQGAWAYSLGHEASANPYVSDSYLFDWWQEGWYDGQENCEG